MPSVPLGVLEGRRERALGALSAGALLLPAAPLRVKNGDSEYRYRPDSELYYLSGWDRTGAVALFRGFADEARVVLFVEARDPDKELWTGPRLDTGEVQALTGADEVRSLESLAEDLPDLLVGCDELYYRLGADPLCDRLAGEAFRRGRRQRDRTGKGIMAIKDPGLILDPIRIRKDAFELEQVRRAADITVASFLEVLPRVAAGVGEWEIEARLNGAFRGAGGEGPAFATIVGAGSNACTLHYVDNRATIEPGDLVLIDAGAEFAYYAGDVTRTVPASREWVGVQRDIYVLVEAAQQAALSAAGPGVAFDDVHRAAVGVICEGLSELGVLDESPDTILAEELYRAFFPHRTSHWLGLDTHDVGAYSTSAGSVLLEPGMVLTVEPGLYFPPGSGAARADVEGIGVRIEDDVLITEDGADVLTGALPTSPAKLVAVMGAA